MTDNRGHSLPCAWLRRLSLVLLLGMPLPAWAEARVVDGDTLEIDGTVFRLNGIDAPEAKQGCEAWACGAAATEALTGLIGGADPACAAHGKDIHGRTIATCRVGGQDIGAAMVRTGYAWAFVKYSDVYVAQEAEARAAGVGIWAHRSVPAWEYRAAQWVATTQAAPEGCPIKGNISGNGQIYHTPWSPNYEKTRINTARGERWFCSEAEAIAAGWRAPR